MCRMISGDIPLLYSHCVQQDRLQHFTNFGETPGATCTLVWSDVWLHVLAFVFFNPYLTTAHDCRYVTVALAIAHYYWTRGNRDVMPRFPVLHAARTTLRWSILITYQNSMHCILQGDFHVTVPICAWQQQLTQLYNSGAMSVVMSHFSKGPSLTATITTTTTITKAEHMYLVPPPLWVFVLSAWLNSLATCITAEPVL